MSKIKVAFYGTGGIAGKHSKGLEHNPDVEIVGGCDVKAENVDAFWQRTIPEYKTSAGSAPKSFSDAEQMFSELKPDAVVICTPHTLHFDHAMQALNHGCHVLMEKPMVTQADQAYTLRDKVKETGKVFVIGYNTPCSPEYQYIRELIRSQELGKLEVISGYLSQNWRKFTVGMWRQDPALSGGGQAYDSGAHLLNSLCWSVESDIAEVHAFVDNMDTRVDINSTINIRFENGVMAAIMVSGNCPANGSHMTYCFGEGKIDVDPWGAGWIKIWKGSKEVKYPPIQGDPVAPCDNWIDAIMGRAEPRTMPQNGIVQSELMDAIYQSARTGQPAKPKRLA